MEEILIGTTDRTILVFIPDPASTDGSGKTGLVAANLTVSYTRVETDNDVVVTDVTSSLSDLSALTDAHADWGLKEVSSTLAPGLYRLDIADAVYATGAWYAVVYVEITTSAAGATPKAFKLVNFEMFGQSAIDLKDFADDGYDPATNKVQGVVLVDSATTVTGNVNGSVGGNVTGSVGSVGGNVGGSVGSVGANGIAAASFQAGAINAAAIADGAIDAAALATDAVQEIRDAITGGAYALSTDANGRIRIVDGTSTGEIDTTNGAVTHVILTDTITTYTGNTPQTGDAFARIGANGSGLSAIPWNASWDTEVQSEVDDALVAQRLDELLNADSDIDGAQPPTVGSVFHELMTKTAGSFTYDQTTDSMEAIRDRGDAAWTTATGFSTHSAADVWAVATRLLTAGTNIVLTKGTGVTGFNDLDAAGVRSAVGLASANLDTQLDALPTANEVRNAVTGGAYALSTDANGRVRIVDGTGAGELDTASGVVIARDHTGAALATAASIAALNNLSAAQVNAEVVDVLATDTYAEPGQGAPAATLSLAAKINYLFKWRRNKADNDGTQNRYYADDASTIDQKQTTTSSGGTVTIGEMATGA